MKICIMHFASRLLRIFLAKILFQKFLLLVLSRCCFHHLVENSILYKKDIKKHFDIGPILFSENKIIRSVVGRKVDGQILFGARSEKPKMLFGARGEKPKNLFNAKWQLRINFFGSQMVKPWEAPILRCHHVPMFFDDIVFTMKCCSCKVWLVNI